MNNIDKIISLVIADAAAKRESAAYGGEMGDGGAGRLMEQVAFYRWGRAGSIPDQWKHYETELDPEYQEYQRLKKKFEQ